MMARPSEPRRVRPAKPGSARSRLAQPALFDIPAQAPAQPATIRDRSGPPPSYPDALLWDMAEFFAEKAYKNQVSLGGRGVPWLYKAFADVVDHSGLRTHKWTRLNKDTGQVYHPDASRVARNVVAYFWQYPDYWAEEGDVVGAFTDPLVFRQILKAIDRAWKTQAARHKAEADHVQATDGREPPVVTRKPGNLPPRKADEGRVRPAEEVQRIMEGL